MRRVNIGKVRIPGKSLVIASPHTIHDAWARTVWNGRDTADRSLSVSGCLSALARPQDCGALLGRSDATGGFAAVCRVDGELAQVTNIYDDNGRLTKVEIDIVG